MLQVGPMFVLCARCALTLVYAPDGRYLWLYCRWALPFVDAAGGHILATPAVQLPEARPTAPSCTHLHSQGRLTCTVLNLLMLLTFLRFKS